MSVVLDKVAGMEIVLGAVPGGAEWVVIEAACGTFILAADEHGAGMAAASLDRQHHTRIPER